MPRADLGEMVFFFFQAEDGIRDVAVTGVQTCALPISALVIELREQRGDRRHPNAGEHLTDPYPDASVRLLGEESGERLYWFRAGKTQVFGRDVHRSRPRISTRELHD